MIKLNIIILMHWLAIFLALIVKKLFLFYILESFNNNFLYIGARDIYLPPFDASGYDEYKKLYFFFLWSLGGELLRFNDLPKIQFFNNFINFDM